MNKVWIICQTDFTTSGHVKLIRAYSNQIRAKEDLALITSLGQGPEYVLHEMDLLGEVSQLHFKPGMRGLDTSCQGGVSLQKKPNPIRLSGANGMKCGDRVLYRTPSGLKYGNAGEFTQDGDCYVMFDDDHVSVPVKWAQLELAESSNG